MKKLALALVLCASVAHADIPVHDDMDFQNASTIINVLTAEITTLQIPEPGPGPQFTSFVSPSLAANVTYTLPPDDGDAGEQLQTNGSGTLTWEPAGDEILVNAVAASSPTDFNDTTPAVPAGGQNVDWQLSGASVSAHLQLDAIETSIIADSADDTDLGSTSFPWNEIFATTLRVHEAPGSGTNRSTFTQPAIGVDIAYTLPTDDGDANEKLQTNGSGVLSWEPDVDTGDEITINTVSVTGPVDFDDATPAAPAGGQNVDWQTSGSDVSAHLRLDAIETHILPDSADDTDLGATSFPWNEVFLTTLRVHEAPGSGTNRSTFTQPALAGDLAYTLPTDDGDAGEQLTTDGSGVLTWEAASAGGGDEITVNTVAITSPVDFDDATPAAPAGGQNIDWQTSGSDVSAHLQLDAIETSIIPDSADDTDLGATSFPWNEVIATTFRVHEAPASGTNRSTFTQPAMVADLAYTLPTAQGDAGATWVNNGSGALSWTRFATGLHVECIDDDGDNTCEIYSDAGDEVFFDPDDNGIFDAKFMRSGGIPQIILHDSDLADAVIDSFRIENPCPTTGSGSEDCDVYLYSLSNGSAITWLTFIGDLAGAAVMEIGGVSVNAIAITTNSTGDGEFTVPGSSIALTTETAGNYVEEITSESNDGLTQTTCSGAEDANCDLDFDIDDLASFSALAVDDELAVSDTSDSATEKRITAQEFIHDGVVMVGGTFSGSTAISSASNTNIVSASAANTNGRAVYVECTVQWEKTDAGNDYMDFFIDLDGSNVATWRREILTADDPNFATFHYANNSEGSADTNTYSCQAQLVTAGTVNALEARITVMAF